MYIGAYSHRALLGYKLQADACHSCDSSFAVFFLLLRLSLFCFSIVGGYVKRGPPGNIGKPGPPGKPGNCGPPGDRGVRGKPGRGSEGFCALKLVHILRLSRPCLWISISLSSLLHIFQTTTILLYLY